MNPYNPLEKSNLGKSVADSLAIQHVFPLRGVERFSGAGLYAIYYRGEFDLYRPFRELNPSESELNVPIYIGKATPRGGRKGKIDPDVSRNGFALYNRLFEHRRSIEQVSNLKVEDFFCRYLVVDDIWIPLGEALMIQRYQPIWNSLIDGFGNHDPGAGRHKGAKPSWDTLHPGRIWAERRAPSSETVEQLTQKIASYWSRPNLSP